MGNTLSFEDLQIDPIKTGFKRLWEVSAALQNLPYKSRTRTKNLIVSGVYMESFEIIDPKYINIDLYVYDGKNNITYLGKLVKVCINKCDTTNDGFFHDGPIISYDESMMYIILRKDGIDYRYDCKDYVPNSNRSISIGYAMFENNSDNENPNNMKTLMDRINAEKLSVYRNTLRNTITEKAPINSNTPDVFEYIGTLDRPMPDIRKFSGWIDLKDLKDFNEYYISDNTNNNIYKCGTLSYKRFTRNGLWMNDTKTVPDFNLLINFICDGRDIYFKIPSIHVFYSKYNFFTEIPSMSTYIN